MFLRRPGAGLGRKIRRRGRARVWPDHRPADDARGPARTRRLLTARVSAFTPSLIRCTFELLCYRTRAVRAVLGSAQLASILCLT